MKVMITKIYRKSSLLIGAALFTFHFSLFTACSSDFLDEELTTKYSTDYFDTEEGLEALAVSLYGNIRWHFGYEWAYGITLYGTDEFTSGNDLTSDAWNEYDTRFGPSIAGTNRNCPQPQDLWNEVYYGIASCNTIIAKADIIKDETVRNRCLAHAYFLRGYNYYRLTAQYGGVVLQLTPVNDVVRNFTRSSEQECWEQVISDLRQAYNLFKGEEFTYGKGITWTKATAAHFLAKALLFRASERCDDFNSATKEADLREAIEMCSYAIGARKLSSNYSDLYANWTGVDCAVEQQDEILMAAGFNNSNSTIGRYGNRTYNYFCPQFSNFSNGWVKRGVWIGDMDFQRCRPTEYTYAAYDHVNDARLWKTFKTVFGVNNVADKTKDISLGDPGVVMILNTKDDHTYDGYTFGANKQEPTFRDDAGRLPEWRDGQRQTATSGELTSTPGQWIPNSSVLYQNGQYVAPTFMTPGYKYSNFFAGINKTVDGTRQAEKGDSFRDVIMARLGETYLMRAECYARLGDFDKAKADINVIRARAQWQQGENRSYYVDGSKAFEGNGLNTGNAAEMYKNSNLWMNTYYLSNPQQPVTTEASVLTDWTWDNLPAEDEAILAKLGVSGQKERAIQFILNERTRELIGEWQRWETLSRTKTLVQRAKAFNTEAQAVQDRHLYRPIPQSFIDGLKNEDGSDLTDEQKKAWQNPGY